MIYPLALASLITCLVSLEAAQVLSGVVEDKYSCPHGWTRYGGKKCLKYVNELQDYERAQATCRSKNQGTLVTIHSHEEQNFVYSYIHSIAASSTPIWLGAKQIDFESILWLDKTENSYTNWAPSEPSHPDEICIAINPRNGQWHDVMCTEANVPACERAPTTQWPFFVAFCSEGWFQFNDEKCVRIISSQALNFYESQELCRSKYNSKLLSIKTDKESEFVHNLIKFRDVKLPVWLGAVQNDFSSFNWIDKSDVTFTNWAEGEPNDPDHACISMVASGGKWSDNDCKEQKLILCQKVPEEGSCETGWLQFRQDKCYRFVHIRLAFDDAETLCQNLYAGHLPSIHSQEEQFMISQFLASVNVKNGSEIWLGARQMDFHNFNWGDGSAFNYSYWEQGEPSFPAEKCIEMSWRNGRWNDINCRLKRAVLCERQITSRHHLKPILYQPFNCLESNCTGNSPAASSGSMVIGVSSSASAANSNSLNIAQATSSSSPSGHGSDLSVIQAAPIDPQLLADSANGTNSPNTINASAPNINEEAQVNFMLQAAQDDRPIKVIASIMNRGQQQRNQQAVEAAMAAAHELSPTNRTAMLANNNSSSQQMNYSAEASPNMHVNSTFIHYNLPPPERMFDEDQSVASQPHVGPSQMDQQISSSSLPVLSSSDHSTGSLLDKLKPLQILTTVAAPSAQTNPSEANTTALNAPVANAASTSGDSSQAPGPQTTSATKQPPNNLQQQMAPATTQEFVQVTSAASSSSSSSSPATSNPAGDQLAASQVQTKKPNSTQ